MTARTTAPYSSRIIKASALLTDTRILLARWDPEANTTQNLAQLRRENQFGKASRSRIEDILVILRQRYLGDPGLLAALIRLERGGAPAEVLRPILYFQATQADALLHDAVITLLAPLVEQGRREVTPRDVEIWIEEQVAAGKTIRPWGAETIERVAQGVLATLRDFGILQGAANKRLAPVYLPIPAFAFLAFQLYRRQPSGDQVLHSEEWRLFFLSTPAIERLFLEAHQEAFLSYYAAGRVVRIEFPAPTIEEYARVLTDRAA